MPNQSDAYRMADTIGVGKRRLTGALAIAIVLGITVPFSIALMIWYGYGAGSKTDPWRTFMGRQPFDQLADALNTPVHAGIPGTLASSAGFVIMLGLRALRSAFTWWRLHAVG